MNYSKYVPGFAVMLTALYFASQMVPRTPDSPFNLDKFARLPVVERGRVKPIDTLARTDLMLVSDRQDYKEFATWEDYRAGNTTRQPAVKWLLDTLAYHEVINLLRKEGKVMPRSFEHHVVRIENDQVLDFLDLKTRPSFLRYSIAEIHPKMDEFYEKAHLAQDLDPKERSLLDTKILELANRMEIYSSLITLHGSRKPEIIPHLVPPTKEGDEWQTLTAGIAELVQNPAAWQNARTKPAAKAWIEMLDSYRTNDPKTFNAVLDEYYASVESLMPGDLKRSNMEVFFNRFAPFYHCSILYALLFLIACLSWMLWPQTLNRTAFWVMVLVVTVHTMALTARMVIQGRPPVTNLYSSAVYIGWTGVLTCLFVEYFFRNGLAMAAGSILGFLSLIVAHFLSTSGDTLEMMQAVLDTNFWLATHVTTVTFGYTATFLAGFMAILYVALGVFSNRLAGGAATTLSKAIYGVICFAMFLSFVGTVLGGIWADQSWGRFWGWDPKENGALLIVLWNALILHARWGGMVKQRGVALLAVLGNIVTAWSWFGTNLLGVGLHSYGFMSGAMYWLLVFGASQVAIVAVGLIPMRFWKSFRPQHPTPPASTERPTPALV